MAFNFEEEKVEALLESKATVRTHEKKTRRSKRYDLYRDEFGVQVCRLVGNFFYPQGEGKPKLGFAPWCHFCVLEGSEMKAYFIKGCTDPMLGHFMTVTESIYHLGYAERPQELAYAGCQWSWDSNPAARACGAPANINDYGGTTSYVVHKNATGVGYTWMSYSNMWHGFYKTFRGQLFQFPPYEPTVMYPEEFDMEFNPPDHNELSWFKLQLV